MAKIWVIGGKPCQHPPIHVNPGFSLLLRDIYIVKVPGKNSCSGAVQIRSGTVLCGSCALGRYVYRLGTSKGSKIFFAYRGSAIMSGSHTWRLLRGKVG